MARATLTKTDLTVTAFNLTDATFATLATGTGNGVEFTFKRPMTAYLKNDTGGSAVFTIATPANAPYSDYSLAVGDYAVTVADGKTHMLSIEGAFNQADGKVYIDCDVAGKVMVLNR